MSIAEFNSKCKDVFNKEEQEKIEKTAVDMFRDGIVTKYLPVGKKEVCLERDSVKNKTVQVFLMNDTLEMNNKLVTAFNKRKKTGRNRVEADKLILDSWMKENFTIS